MNPEKRALEVMGLGLLIVVGAYFQFRQIRRDWEKAQYPPQRLYIPLVVSGMVFLGFLFLGILSLVDARKPDADLEQVFKFAGKAIVFSLLLNGKALLSPAFVVYSLGDALYCWCEHDQLKLWTLLNELLEWVFDGFSRWFKYAYLSLTFGYALVCSIIEEWLG